MYDQKGGHGKHVTHQRQAVEDVADVRSATKLRRNRQRLEGAMTILRTRHGSTWFRRSEHATFIGIRDVVGEPLAQKGIGSPLTDLTALDIAPVADIAASIPLRLWKLEPFKKLWITSACDISFQPVGEFVTDARTCPMISCHAANVVHQHIRYD